MTMASEKNDSILLSNKVNCCQVLCQVLCFPIICQAKHPITGHADIGQIFLDNDGGRKQFPVDYNVLNKFFQGTGSAYYISLIFRYFLNFTAIGTCKTEK